jgi:hypothetical protein
MAQVEGSGETLFPGRPSPDCYEFMESWNNCLRETEIRSMIQR